MDYDGEKISAERAKEVGLVSSLHESHEEMIDSAFEMAEKLASKTPLAMWVTKKFSIIQEITLLKRD